MCACGRLRPRHVQTDDGRSCEGHILYFFCSLFAYFFKSTQPFRLEHHVAKGLFFLIRCVACVFLNIQISQAACVRIYIFECMRKVH